VAVCPLSQNWERARVRVQDSTSGQLTPHPNLLPSRGEGVKAKLPPRRSGILNPLSKDFKGVFIKRSIVNRALGCCPLC